MLCCFIGLLFKYMNKMFCNLSLMNFGIFCMVYINCVNVLYKIIYCLIERYLFVDFYGVLKLLIFIY